MATIPYLHYSRRHYKLLIILPLSNNSVQVPNPWQRHRLPKKEIRSKGVASPPRAEELQTYQWSQNRSVHLLHYFPSVHLPFNLSPGRSHHSVNGAQKHAIQPKWLPTMIILKLRRALQPPKEEGLIFHQSHRT